MIRILVVVVAFVLVNTVGFVAYRSSRPLAAEARSFPASEATMAAPARPTQPKPPESTAHTVAPSAPSDLAGSPVSQPTIPSERVPAKPLAAQPTRSTVIKRRVADPVPNKPTEKKADKSEVLDMDENPYKRGE